MLCPEVWTFKAPESTLSTEETQLTNSKPQNIIKSCTFNHLVSFILPDTVKVPDSLWEGPTPNSSYYRIKDFRITDLISTEFVNGFIKSGSLYILSVESRIDCDNCVAVTPNGLLLLNLNKDTYQSLGLEGKVSHFHSKNKEKYIVTIDLKRDQFKHGKQRTSECLSRLEETFDVIATWEPANGEHSSREALKRHFCDLGYKVKTCETQFKGQTQYNLAVPLDVHDPDFAEWLGLVSLPGDLELDERNDYASSYSTPEPADRLGQVKCLQWRGFFTVEQISKIWTKLKEHNEKSNLLWCSMYVQGFSDSSVAWNSQEHHYYTNGDNSYLFIIKGQSCFICTQQCSRKQYINRSR